VLWRTYSLRRAQLCFTSAVTAVKIGVWLRLKVTDIVVARCVAVLSGGNPLNNNTLRPRVHHMHLVCMVALTCFLVAAPSAECCAGCAWCAIGHHCRVAWALPVFVFPPVRFGPGHWRLRTYDIVTFNYCNGGGCASLSGLTLCLIQSCQFVPHSLYAR
jgi:hypothetical protein